MERLTGSIPQLLLQFVELLEPWCRLQGQFNQTRPRRHVPTVYHWLSTVTTHVSHRQGDTSSAPTPQCQPSPKCPFTRTTEFIEQVVSGVPVVDAATPQPGYPYNLHTAPPEAHACRRPQYDPEEVTQPCHIHAATSPKIALLNGPQPSCPAQCPKHNHARAHAAPTALAHSYLLTSTVQQTHTGTHP